MDELNRIFRTCIATVGLIHIVIDTGQGLKFQAQYADIPYVKDSASTPASAVGQSGPVTPVAPASGGASSLQGRDPGKTAQTNDTVNLSLAAQVQLLKYQGELPAMIAAKLGLTVDKVESYLESGDPSAVEAIIGS